MKKNILKMAAFCCGLSLTFSVQAQLKVRNDAFIQIGYDDYRTLTFGKETNSPNNGKYAVEYWQENGGLNFWKPWPTPGAANFVLFLRDDSNVGIGTVGVSNYKLDVNGKVRAVSYFSTSDRRLKSNIKPLGNGLTKVLQLKPVSYNYSFNISKYSDASAINATEAKQQTMNIDATLKPDPDLHLGFIAQDVKEILPELVQEDEKGYLSLNYVEMIPLLVDAIKEQQSTIEDLENRLALLENTTDGQTKKLNSKKVETEGSSKLFQNAPNPFDKVTQIRYYISEGKIANAFLQIHDTKGVLLQSIVLKTIAGENMVELDLSNVGNGIYFYSLVVDGIVVDAQRMVVQRN